MRQATKSPCDKSQACLIGAGGVRGVTEAEGKNPFQLDSKEPQWDKFQDYLKGEVRFASVAKQFPKETDELFLAARA